MPTVDHLMLLNAGVILIQGQRRSGKSYLCDLFRQRWASTNLTYRFFSPVRPFGPAASTWDGSPTRDNWNIRMRGFRRAIIDEPDRSLHWQDVGFADHLILATSEAPSWMIAHANWFLHVNGPGRYEVYPGLPTALNPLRPGLTLWERLLLD